MCDLLVERARISQLEAERDAAREDSLKFMAEIQRLRSFVGRLEKLAHELLEGGIRTQYEDK